MVDITRCLKCGHNITKHQISVVGNWEYEEIACSEVDDTYDGNLCGCDAGFRKVAIKKEFTTMEG